MAQWKDMVSDARYEVSDQGSVRRKDTQRIRVPSSTPANYQVIVLSIPSGKFKGVYVHREVMRAFVGECPPDCEVSHLSGDNTDNRLTNLIYENRLTNMRRKKEHGTQAYGASHQSSKLTEDMVQDIWRLSVEGLSQNAIAKHMPVSRSQIGRILRGEHWGYIEPRRT
jgi:hypothetical protein